MYNKCISNKTGHKDIKIGAEYELLEHSDPKLVWVKIPDNTISIGWRTVQSYASDFISIEKWRNNQINKLL